MTFFPSGSMGMNGVFVRVRELYTFSGGKRELASGCKVGWRHGGCWRVELAMVLEIMKVGVDDDAGRCLNTRVKEQPSQRGGKGINK